MSLPLVLALIAVGIAALPLAMTLWNLSLYRRAVDERPEGDPRIFVCIPARDEEANIADCVRAALANDHANLRVLVYDDESTDRTPKILAEIAASDDRLVRVPTHLLPDGWNGKQHACWRMGRYAIEEIGAQPDDRLLFTDADVRLSADCLRRAAAEQDRLDCAFISAFPRQLTGSIGEALMVPMMFYLLLGYLPIARMRSTTEPGTSAACGQFMFFRVHAYEVSGGHEKVADSMHEGVKLPRVIRSLGMKTDLFDATDTASVRMYRGFGETWRGFAKNAYEGLGSVGLLCFMTVLHAIGHVGPWILLTLGIVRSDAVLMAVAAVACLVPILQRVILATRLRHSLAGALLHPIGVVLMTLVQWWSYALHLAGRRSWRGRVASTS